MLFLDKSKQMQLSGTVNKHSSFKEKNKYSTL